MKLEDIVYKIMVDSSLNGIKIRQSYIQEIKKWAKGCVPEMRRERGLPGTLPFIMGLNNCREKMLKNIEEQ